VAALVETTASERASQMHQLSDTPRSLNASQGPLQWRRRQPVPLTAALSIALGVIWIIDGLLQLQPAQFGSEFAVGIEMNAMAQPSAIAHLELAFGRLTSSAVAPSTVLIAAVQLLIGAALLTRRTRFLGLAASIPWALAIWAVGEGFGGIATGYAMLPTGAPGAALACALLATLLVLDLRSGDDALRRRHFRCTWTALWVLAAGLQLGSRVPLSLLFRANFNESAGGEPGALSGLDHHLAEITSAHAVATTVLLALVELLLASAPWLGHERLTLVTTFGVLLVFWVCGENLGGVLTWSASDVGIMPLMALIALGTFDVPLPSRSYQRLAERPTFRQRVDDRGCLRPPRRARAQLDPYGASPTDHAPRRPPHRVLKP
jgi:hypothetical protein